MPLSSALEVPLQCASRCNCTWTEVLSMHDASIHIMLTFLSPCWRQNQAQTLPDTTDKVQGLDSCRHIVGELIALSYLNGLRY